MFEVVRLNMLFSEVGDFNPLDILHWSIEEKPRSGRCISHSDILSVVTITGRGDYRDSVQQAIVELLPSLHWLILS